MKTKIYSVMAALALSLAFSTAKAQTGVELGVTVAPGIAAIYGNNDVEDALGPRFSFAAGGTFQYNFTPGLALHTGLIFERKGGFDRSEYTFFGNTVVTRTTVNFDYLTVPILFRATFLPEGGPRLFVNAGPYLGFLLSQSTVIHSRDENDNEDKSKTRNTNDYKAFDVGLALGVGVKIPIADRMNLGLEVRDNLGFFNYSESNADNDRLKNNSLLFLVSLNFVMGAGTQ